MCFKRSKNEILGGEKVELFDFFGRCVFYRISIIWVVCWRIKIRFNYVYVGLKGILDGGSNMNEGI